DIDVTAADVLHQLVDDLTEAGVELRFCELKGSVRERLDTYRAFDVATPDHSARTTGEAVKQYLLDHPTDWVDWEDR
ncbi:MAG: STAS domain-containing protein, partial [Actinomycetota bacterium]|nr:STAS domain-containing protein [Actinomycetota bacterium]